ncbi:MAG: hypothetical protein ACE37K_08975 [Planctomycetota bacterium]
MIRLLSRVAACAWLTGLLSAQDQQLDEVLAPFPDDDVPTLLLQLHGPSHEQAVERLGKKGPRVHVYLLGKARQPLVHSHRDFSAAFGEFGPDCGWALPAILDAARAKWMATTLQGLARRLGPTGRPAALVSNGPFARRLRRELLALPDEAVEQVPMHVEVVAAAHRDALLQRLADDGRPERWWPALQALLAIDLEASLAACEILLPRTTSSDAATRSRSRELLHAVRCYHAASSIMATKSLHQLPVELEDELLRAVLGACPYVPPANERHPTGHARLPREIVASDAPIHQLATALAGAMHSAQPQRTAQDLDRLARLAAARDPRTARFARVLGGVVSEKERAWFGKPVSRIDHAAVEHARRADRMTLRRFGLARLREVLAQIAMPPGRAEPEQAKDVAGRILQGAARPSGRQTIDEHRAQEFVRVLVQRMPALVEATELTDADHSKLVKSLFRADALVPALYQWAFLHAETSAPKGRRSPNYVLPAACAETVAQALASPEHQDRALALLHLHSNYTVWVEFCDQHAERLLEVAAQAPERRRHLLGRLLRYGSRARAVAERAMLDEALDGELRDAIAKDVGINPNFPPTAAFVVEALASPRQPLRRHALWAAPFVADDKPAVAAALLELTTTTDEALLRQVLGNLGRLRADSARTTIEGFLGHNAHEVRRDAAIALLQFDERDDAAFGELRRQLDDGDADRRRIVWSAISQAEGASARFLERAVEDLIDADDLQSQWRLTRVVRSAHARRPDDARATLLRLTRCGVSVIEQGAEQALKQLDRKR